MEVLTRGVKIHADLRRMAEGMEESCGYTVTSTQDGEVRVAFQRNPVSGRRNRRIVEVFRLDGLRVGTYDLPATIEIFD